MPDPAPAAISVKPRRRNNLQYLAGWDAYIASPEALAFAELVRTAGEDFIRWATTTKERRATLAARFMGMHTMLERWAAYRGREFTVERLLGAHASNLSLIASVSDLYTFRTRPGLHHRPCTAVSEQCGTHVSYDIRVPQHRQE